MKSEIEQKNIMEQTMGPSTIPIFVTSILFTTAMRN